MLYNLTDEQFELAEIGEQPVLISDSRIAKSAVPEGWYCYDLRGSDYDPGLPVTLENRVAINHAGTVLSPAKIAFDDGGDRLDIREKLNYLGDYISLEDFCEEYGIAVPSLLQSDGANSGIQMGGM